MIELSTETITILMFGGILIGVIFGYPIGLVLGAISIIFGYTIWGNLVAEVIYGRVVSVLLNYVLLAVPLFIFMGLMLGSSGIAEKMFDVLYIWLGGLRGGLAVVTVIMGTILAACVGTITAEVTMLSLVALPPMLKRGYTKSLACGSICAGGCLGILIPPSVMLVVYGPMAEISVGKLFMGAFVPGFILSGLYISYILLRGLFQPQVAPSVSVEERAVPFTKKIVMLITALAPPGLLILSVLGTIFFGIAPPTEAAGIGAFVATLLAITYRRFSWRVLKEVTLLTMKFCGFIFLIATMAISFTSVFLGLGCGDVVKDIMLSAPGGRWGVFTMIMFIMFILGMFISWMGILFILVPIMTPVGAALGFDPVWFGIMICVNLQMAFMTPPFAVAIFVLRGAADPALGVTMMDIIRGVIPFVILIMVGLGLCVAFPQLILWLPAQMIKGF